MFRVKPVYILAEFHVSHGACVVFEKVWAMPVVARHRRQASMEMVRIGVDRLAPMGRRPTKIAIVA
jgi:hypothetical protein